MAAISNDWLAPLSGEFKKPYYRKLYETVKQEYQTRQIFPDADDIFNAFAFTPLANVKAVILGRSLSQRGAGPRALLFGEAGCGDSAVVSEYLSGSFTMTWDATYRTTAI